LPLSLDPDDLDAVEIIEQADPAADASADAMAMQTDARRGL
jgi:hypothetical protein